MLIVRVTGIAGSDRSHQPTWLMYTAGARVIRSSF